MKEEIAEKEIIKNGKPWNVVATFNYYNEAVLITAVGSLPLRSGKIMKKSRKLGKTHQNIFYSPIRK